MAAARRKKPRRRFRKQPAYRLHKRSGLAVVTLNGRDVYLGKHGSPESQAEYDRLIAEWRQQGPQVVAVRVPGPPPAQTVAEIIRAFWKHATTYYRKADGTPTSEATQIKMSLRVLRHAFGDLPVGEFGPVKFKAVRELMIRGYRHPKFGDQQPLSRRVINHRMERVRRMFRWAAEHEMAPPSIWQALAAVPGLQAGRSDARETEPVQPVELADVDACRPFLSRQVVGMIDLQLLTGARPGEICVMRGCDIDMSGATWIYRPASHKNTHRNQKRHVLIGPKAQEVLRPFLKADASAYLFSPREVVEEQRAARRVNLKRKQKPRKRNPKRRPGERYNVGAYWLAIVNACERAFPLPAELDRRILPDGQRETRSEWKARLTPAEHAAVKEWRRTHSWHPHQLRHTAATQLRKTHGIEAARIILGHKTAFTTEIYAEVDQAKAAEVIAQIG